MYSVILMAAMTTGAPETPSFGCHGGPIRSACSCNGGLFLHGSCYGNCYGCYGSGCWGSCYGCWGSGGCYGCRGCHGCYGSGWSSGYGCNGGCWGSCNGSWGDWSSPYPATYPGGNPMVTPPGKVETAPPPKKEGAAAPVPPPTAKLIIETPANAKLFVDDAPMAPAPSPRAFATPALNPSQTYYYVVRVETEVDGKPVSESRRVLVKAGETIRATFTEATVQAAQAGQSVTVTSGGGH